MKKMAKHALNVILSYAPIAWKGIADNIDCVFLQVAKLRRSI